MTERERAEQWLALEIATRVSEFWSTMTPEDAYENEHDGWHLAASIAADFAERLAKLAYRNAVRAAAEQNKKLMMEDQDALYRKMLPIPWAEAIPKEGGMSDEPPQIKIMECRHGLPIQRGASCSMCDERDAGRREGREAAISAAKKLREQILATLASLVAPPEASVYYVQRLQAIYGDEVIANIIGLETEQAGKQEAGE